MKRAQLLAIASTAAAAVTLAACGNYSNEDIDFQLSVPKTEELSTRLPFSASAAPDTAEYYRATREVGSAFNRFVVDVTSLMDSVRVTRPSARTGDERIWGPFVDRGDRSWEVRLRMSRDPASPDPAFRYAFEFHRAGPPGSPWQQLLGGTFGLYRDHGEMILDLTDARASGYPVDGFRDLARLTLRYERRHTPIELTMMVENVDDGTNPGASYRYLENADGSGELAFVSRRASARLTLEVRSRWNPGGAGRADARIGESTAPTGNPRGIDCWAADGHASYVLREYGMRREEGSAAACVFGPP